MKLYTKKQIAKKLHLSERTISQYIKDGSLEAKKIGGSDKKAGKILITEKALKDFIDNS